MRVNPSRRFAFTIVRKISAPQTPISRATRNGGKLSGKAVASIDAIGAEELTVDSRGLLASSMAEQKALRTLPALQAPTC